MLSNTNKTNKKFFSIVLVSCAFATALVSNTGLAIAPTISQDNYTTQQSSQFQAVEKLFPKNLEIHKLIRLLLNFLNNYEQNPAPLPIYLGLVI
ncbi:MAG: hypothetical protein ACFB2X_25150 [Rivularia sp. (in: cyanobacteria)]